MKRDSLFYTIFQQYPALLFRLLENAPDNAANYRFESVYIQDFCQNSHPTHTTLMFHSWLERWNNFAPVYLGGDELIAYLNSAVFIRNHKIQTRSYQLHKGCVNGFVGNVSLQVLSRADPLLANVANLLVEYARFSGKGIKTRLGMGQTLIISSN